MTMAYRINVSQWLKMMLVGAERPIETFGEQTLEVPYKGDWSHTMCIMLN